MSVAVLPSGPIVGSAICVVMLIALLVAEARRSKRAKYAAKPLASLCFIAVAASGGGLSEAYSQWILIGLVLGAGGDVALMFDGDKSFMVGLVSFLLGHLAYVVAISIIVPPSAWATPHALTAVFGSAVVAAYLWPHLGSMKLPVAVYVFVITAMVVGAIAVAASGMRMTFSAERIVMLTVGAVAFFASDIAVARERFVSSGFVNKAWGLPAYYGGQLLLAWSTVA